MIKNKVLLVDDDPDEVELLKETFAELSPKVACYGAENGRVALDLLDSWAGALPDVILLDINMPVMNGWEFMKKVQRSEKLKAIPIIMYTTSGREQDKQLASELGAYRFIQKPDNYGMLRRQLESLLVFMQKLLVLIWPEWLRDAVMAAPRLIDLRPAVLLSLAGK